MPDKGTIVVTDEQYAHRLKILTANFFDSVEMLSDFTFAFTPAHVLSHADMLGRGLQDVLVATNTPRPTPASISERGEVHKLAVQCPGYNLLCSSYVVRISEYRGTESKISTRNKLKCLQIDLFERVSKKESFIKYQQFTIYRYM